MGKAFLVLAAVVLVIFAVFWLRAGRPWPSRPSRPIRPSVVGPDDDPDFLRGLDTPPHRDADEEQPPAS
ncbi:hypothetical protein BH18ACT8_BH18ACT8_08150 [soil metagenome]